MDHALVKGQILAQWRETVYSIMKPFLQRSPFGGSPTFQHMTALVIFPLACEHHIFAAAQGKE